MANISVKLYVDVDKLQRITQNNQLGTDNSWATIQLGDGPISNTPTQFEITAEQGDVITWSGIAQTVTSGPQPLINITCIDFGDNESKFISKKQHIPINGGATYEATANAALATANYNIDFVVSYLHRVLDPKIKVIAKPH